MGLHFAPGEEEVWISNTSLQRYKPGAVPQSLQEVPLPKEAGVPFGLFAHSSGNLLLGLKAYAPERPGTARFVPLRHPSGLLDGRVNEIEPDGKGKLWIGTADHGLLLFHPPGGAAEQLDHPARSTGKYPFINKIFTASDGKIWVAPGMGGLCKLTPQGDAFQRQCYMEGLFIVDFLEGPDGKLWCAAMNYGLLKFDIETEKYELISMENRLMRNSITGMKMDQLGRIWFTSHFCEAGPLHLPGAGIQQRRGMDGRLGFD